MENLEQRIEAAIEHIVFRRVAADEPLLTSHLIDSVGVVDLIVKLEEELSIRIDTNAVNPDNFNTVQQILAFVSDCLSSAGAPDANP